MFNKKPVIGIMPLYDDEKNSYWMLPEYMKGLEGAGAITLMLSLTDDSDKLDYFVEICDGFLLTGGHDISPELYGEKRSERCGITNILRDNMDKYILERAVDKNMAVLGICRGIQIMNGVYGGTLYQDLESEFSSNLEHHMEPPYDRGIHSVSIVENTPLHNILNKSKCDVNSYHHQAIKDLGSAFKIMAKADDGIIEGIYMPDKKFVLGVQWHPEFSYKVNEDSRKIFSAFVNASIGEN